MCVGHVVHAVCHAHQTHDPKPLTSYTPCPNCTCQHPPSRNNCPAQESACKGCGKRVTGEQHAKGVTPLVHKHPIINPISKIMKRGEYHNLPKPKQRKDPYTKTCLLLQWTVEWVGDMHPKEMTINNITSQQCNEAYTVIKLPASMSSKGTTSVHVKIDTRSGGNILPLHLFQQLHPKQTSPDGLPIGLDHV